MAEASITLLNKPSCSKKRKNDNGQISKNKKSLTNYTDSSTDMTSTLSQRNLEEMDLNVNINQTYKKTYHLGVK